MTKQDRTDEVHALQQQLTSQVAELVTSEEWARMLETAQRFHRYSFGNLMLIMAQRPHATRVAGYKTWQSMGRQVNKGERGIRILAPCAYTRTDEETGDEVRRLFFKSVPVFDIAQTDGAEIPDVRPVLLDGEAPEGLWDGLAAQVKSAGFDLERGECHGANGYTDHELHVVRIRDDVSEAQACKTLAHELAHVLLHADRQQYAGCRGVAEVEAESVAYVVTGASGLATDGYSNAYVAGWAKGDVETVKTTAERVTKTAGAILAALGADEKEEVAA